MGKYDEFLFYDPKEDKIFSVLWDTATGGIDSWMHFDGQKSWHLDRRGYLGEARKRFVLLDQVPEHIHCEGGGYA